MKKWYLDYIYKNWVSTSTKYVIVCPFVKVLEAQPCAGRSQWAEHEDIKKF